MVKKKITKKVHTKKKTVKGRSASSGKAGYVDGYVLVVHKNNVAAYRKLARQAGKIWMKHGALGFKECIGEELLPDMGGYPILFFPMLTNLKPDETVWFSYIEYKNKAHRNTVNKKVMKDAFMQSQDPDHMKKMPFDMKRMSFGGFKVMVSG